MKYGDEFTKLEVALMQDAEGILLNIIMHRVRQLVFTFV